MQPLAGVLVLDFTTLLPGPLATLLLAEAGAEVIKIERPGGEDMRRYEPRFDGESAMFALLNRGKKSLVLDLKSAPDRDQLTPLIKRADVLVEQFRPGVMARLGLGPDAVKAINPKLVYCSITGYGQTGPYRDRPGHDINYLGYAGVLEQTGIAGGPPALSNLQVADLLGGAMNASTAILAALFGASRTGRGTHVDVAMTEGALAHNIFALHAVQTFGHARPRGDDLLTGGVPCYGVYVAQDGRHIAVGALEEKFWRGLCEAIGRPDLIPGQLATGAAGDAVRRQLAAVFAQHPRAHWIERLAALDCCVTPVLSPDEVLDDPQIRARGMIVSVDGVRHYAPPFRLAGHAFTIARSAPAHGEHSAEILREAGLSEEEIDALRARGTLVEAG
jgi:crotonobetainyl-CoA:carnitine CoA-transferase CaiB-like acyl-CoA transferase